VRRRLRSTAGGRIGSVIARPPAVGHDDNVRYREKQPMNVTTIVIILVILLVLGGGWGYSRRGRM
jgi:hypothetical protein